MTRIPQKPPSTSKGSLRDIQVLANEYPYVFAKAMLGHEIEWLSPLKSDAYAEYRDKPFFEKIGLGDKATFPLDDFWPRGGPQWDGLARDKTTGEILLIEAKAHISEIFGSGTQASPKSKEIIRSSLKGLATRLGATYREESWLGPFYQTANRMAYLDYIVNRLNTPARLVYLIFMNDYTVLKQSESKSDWFAAFNVLEQSLDLPKSHALSDLISTVFVDVADIGGDQGKNVHE